MNNSNVSIETITNGSNPRAITMEEIEQLYRTILNIHIFDGWDDVQYAAVRDALRAAAMVVFDRATGYSGKLAVVVWGMGRGEVELFAWDNEGCSKVELDEAWYKIGS